MIAVVSHDAGGAEVLSSYVRRSGLECLFVLAGPARKIFERKLGEVNAMPLDEALLRADSILCGTSWPSAFEWNAMKQARVCGKRSVAILDHWMNYGVRFTREGETCLPDELWVGDAEAEKLARSLFPATKLTLVENPYFLDIREELRGETGVLEYLLAVEPVLDLCAAGHDAGGVPLADRARLLRRRGGIEIVERGQSAVAVPPEFRVGMTLVIKNLILKTN